MKRILAPTDFSSGSDLAISYAKKSALRDGSELHLIHVIQPSAYPIGIEMGHAQVTDIDSKLNEFAEKKLIELSDSLEAEGIKCVTKVLHGRASTEILTYSNLYDIELIYINTHGSSGIEHFLFGSTTEKVLRKSICPVFVVKDTE